MMLKNTKRQESYRDILITSQDSQFNFRTQLVHPRYISSLTHAFTHPLNPLTHSVTRPLAHTLTHSVTRQLTHWPTCMFQNTHGRNAALWWIRRLQCEIEECERLRQRAAQRVSYCSMQSRSILTVSLRCQQPQSEAIANLFRNGCINILLYTVLIIYCINIWTVLDFEQVFMGIWQRE